MQTVNASRRIAGRCAILAAVGAISGAGMRTARGEVSLYEPFNYDPAVVTQIKGQSPDGIRTWQVAGAGSGDLSSGLPHPVAGNLSLPADLVGSTGNQCVYGGVGEGCRIDLSSDHTQLTTNGLTLYYSYAVRVNDLGTIAPGGQILTSFIQQTGGGTGSQASLGAVIYVRAAGGTDYTHYNLGISSHGGTVGEIVWEPGIFDLGSTQFLVASDTMTTAGVNADDISRLWLNPTSLGGNEPAPDFATKITDFNPGATLGDMNAFGSFLIRRVPSGTAATGVNGVILDELRFGTSYAQVTPTLVGSGSWKVDADGSFSVLANWTGAVPHGAGSSATFGSVITSPRVVTIDAPATVGSIVFNSASGYTLAGTATLTIDSPTAGAINVLNGSHTISAPLMLAKDTTITIPPDGETLTIAGNLSAGSGVTLTKAGSGVLQVPRVRAAALAITGGDLIVASDGSDNAASNVQSLSVSAVGGSYAARLDLNNNAMVIDYSGSSPVADVQSALASGYHGGDWTGTGITSATAAAVAADSSNQHKTAIGFAEASDVFGSFPQSFHGQPIDGTSILLSYTVSGDANLDGKVDTLDFNRLAANFGGTGKRWSQADFNYDGIVDTLDFNNLAANFGQQLASSAGGTLVPEPASVMSLATILLPRRYRRRPRRPS
jgi:hypothetical protein